MRWLLFALITTGCQGETVSTTSSDASTTKVDAGPCAPVDGELLRDPSFELWAGQDSVAWKGNLKQLTPAVHCAFAATVTSAMYGGISQVVNLSPRLPVGSTINVRVRAKYVSGNTQRPGFLLYLKKVGVTEPVLVVKHFDNWTTDGAWSDNTGSFLAEAELENITFWLLSGVVEPQVFAVDGASLTVVRPGS